MKVLKNFAYFQFELALIYQNTKYDNERKKTKQQIKEKPQIEKPAVNLLFQESRERIVSKT